MRTKSFKLSLTALTVISSLALSGCGEQLVNAKPASSAELSKEALNHQPTAKEAKAFVDKAGKQLADLYYEASRAEWIYANFITDDTASLAADINEKLTTIIVDLANQAAKYNNLELDYDTRRKLEKLKLALTIPAPSDAKKTAELSKIVADLSGMYGKGKYNHKGETLSLGDMTQIMASSRDYEKLLDIWTGWRQVSPPMRPLYQRQVELANEGAKEFGYADTGAMWRSKYDMPADDFANELDRLWGQVKPLYDALHCHVRAELGEQYGTDKVPQNKPIPAHLLGNMWAQTWGNIYDIAAPENADPGYDVTSLLEKHNYDEIKMVKGAEGFFTSLGFEPLPDTFWERSLFTKPADRDVVCHASAWDLDSKDDLRIKMCIQRTGEEFSVIHHELGHNFYQRAYKNQPVFYQESANDGFHEAIGDTIALSVTPGYLKEIGLLDKVPDESKDLGLLMKMALDKVAFIPFGLLVDQWRWKVFSGEITPEQYNTAWWNLREKYQGVMAPVERNENHFDPGAKYHVPGNTPYTRYFLAHILQFQFHRELCKIAGNEGPVHRCSIYNSKEAGKALNAMLEMGSSRPWQEALEALTGSKEMDATAILDYFAPLKTWLDKQNQGRQCGW
ncbi:M2 family metallopeptidase [Flocculibacter collagenilyticus]|uniref:M2 family metallopeptidase n=1 Tax=Flocculibacter collagenilyticus TaxID=2744479 RepID=UPI0018F3C669|nr:M2 family metallopeptidase [Flocculibacter collagenilyticus]